MNNTQTNETRTQVDPLDKKGHFSRTQLYFISGILALCVIGLSGYLIWDVTMREPATTKTDSRTQPENNHIPSTDTDTTPDTAAILESFTGSAITAELPEGWRIVEGFGAEGSDSLVEGLEYEGLTSIELFTPGNTLAFSLKAIYGIGFNSYCPTYFEFDDDDIHYQTEITKTNQEMGEAVPTIIPISGGSYSEVSLLGASVRRVDSQLYWDTIAGDNFFQAACGGSAKIIMFPDISYTTDANSTNEEEKHGYRWSVSELLTEEEFESLDKILGSMKAIRN